VREAGIFFRYDKRKKGMNKREILVAIAALSMATISGCKKNNDNNTSADQDFMKKAAYGNLAEADAGQLANTKGNDMSVTMFGQMMISDHSTAEAELQTLASSKNVSLPTGPDSAHVAVKSMLMSMSGRAFDSMYIHAQITDHQATIDLMQNEINTGNDNDAKNYANKYLPKVETHKHIADSIATALHF
jgi:putative membrane protein